MQGTLRCLKRKSIFLKNCFFVYLDVPLTQEQQEKFEQERIKEEKEKEEAEKKKKKAAKKAKKLEEAQKYVFISTIHQLNCTSND